MKSNNYSEIENKYHELIQKAKEYMRKITDYEHDISHMYDVVNYTKELLNSIELDVNKDVCVISAYWHDVGRTQQNKGHGLISANELKTEMKKQNYPIEFIEECYKAIYKHEWKEEPETLEGIIIRDADKLDFVGINRWKECIKKDCKFHKMLELLPTTRKDILKLEVSKEIYDREIGKLVVFLHDNIFNKK